MRPLLHGLFSFSKHVYLRNGIYYYQADIPADLAHLFPTSEIKRSLKTRGSTAAKLAALDMELKVQQTDTFLRVCAESDEMSMHVVRSVLPSGRRSMLRTKNLLSDTIKTYTAE